MSDDKDLQQVATVGTTWTPLPAPMPPDTSIAVMLTINVPEYAQVQRNSLTGQLMIDGVSIPDLINLRDALTEQITKLQAGDGWEPI